MPGEVKIGQKWSTWVPGRGQWLLATVIRRDAGQAVLQYDGRYGISHSHDEHKADENTMLENANLFRLVGVPPVKQE